MYRLCAFQVFFERVDDSLLQGFMTAGSDLAQTLDDSDRDELLLNVDTLQKRWKVGVGDPCEKDNHVPLTLIGSRKCLFNFLFVPNQVEKIN